MLVRRRHEWEVSLGEAREIQRELASEVRLEPLEGEVGLVAGADLSFSRGDPMVHAGVVVLRLPGFEVVESVHLSRESRFPYVPGYLSFREIPPLVELFEGLRHTPDAVICDGQGLAHPRRLGLACHLGLLLDLSTVGCAKSHFVGEYQEPGEEKGARSPLVLDGEEVGVVLRSRSGVKPLFVSPGHRIDVPGAVSLVERCLGRYRQPETTRAAHGLVNRVRKASSPGREM